MFFFFDKLDFFSMLEFVVPKCWSRHTVQSTVELSDKNYGQKIIPCSLVITCWESAFLLVLLCVIFPCVFVTFPYDVFGQVWYLIVTFKLGPGWICLKYHCHVLLNFKDICFHFILYIVVQFVICQQPKHVYCAERVRTAPIYSYLLFYFFILNHFIT